MFFFFKRPKIVVDAFTHKELITQLFPVEKSVNSLPEWWKDLPGGFTNPEWPQTEISTVKRCRGIIDLYRQSFTIPLWSDLALDLDSSTGEKKWRYNFADKETPAVPHSTIEFDGANTFKDYQHLKIVSPWFLREKSGVTFLMSQHTWNLSKYLSTFTVLPGVMDFKYQHSININTFFAYKDTKSSILIPAGTPMAHLTPLTEKEVEIKCHTIDTVKFNTMLNIPTFNNNYKKTRAMAVERESKKCPFGFGR